jgi:hypothetical protein
MVSILFTGHTSKRRYIIYNEVPSLSLLLSNSKKNLFLQITQGCPVISKPCVSCRILFSINWHLSSPPDTLANKENIREKERMIYACHWSTMTNNDFFRFTNMSGRSNEMQWVQNLILYHSMPDWVTGHTY